MSLPVWKSPSLTSANFLPPWKRGRITKMSVLHKEPKGLFNPYKSGLDWENPQFNSLLCRDSGWSQTTWCIRGSFPKQVSRFLKLWWQCFSALQGEDATSKDYKILQVQILSQLLLLILLWQLEKGSILIFFRVFFFFFFKEQTSPF